jgi:pimeloyl-ACP methyl ester carboxylesterase
MSADDGRLQAPERGTVEVAGTDIAWERWPRAGAPTVVLVHGTSAHTGWWHHTVPSLAGRLDVVAIDLAGHGDSGHRDAYSIESWGGDVLAVIEQVAGGHALVVAHSIGGLVAAAAAAARPDAVDALVLVDTIVVDAATPYEPFPVVRDTRVFPSADDALRRFRLTPEQPVPDPERLDYVARRSIRAVDGGWAWKFDRRLFGALNHRVLTTPLDGVTCPVAVIRGELSDLVLSDAGEVLGERLGRDVPSRTVPGAHHHVMLDQGPVFDAIVAEVVDDLVAETTIAG